MSRQRKVDKAKKFKGAIGRMYLDLEKWQAPRG